MKDPDSRHDLPQDDPRRLSDGAGGAPGTVAWDLVSFMTTAARRCWRRNHSRDEKLPRLHSNLILIAGGHAFLLARDIRRMFNNSSSAGIGPIPDARLCECLTQSHTMYDAFYIAGVRTGRSTDAPVRDAGSSRRSSRRPHGHATHGGVEQDDGSSQRRPPRGRRRPGAPLIATASDRVQPPMTGIRSGVIIPFHSPDPAGVRARAHKIEVDRASKENKQ